MKAPAFQWYPKDCDTDENVRGMDDREFGFYIRCLNHSWMNDGLPEDLGELARVMQRPAAYVRRVWARVGKCFVPDGHGRLKNPKQEEQRQGYQQFRESRRNAAEARWEKHKQSTSNARALHLECSASASSSAFASKEELPLTPSAARGREDAALPRDALGPVIPIRTARDAGLLPPSGPAPAEEPAPRDGGPEYLAAYPVQVAQDAAMRAYLSVIRTRRQHDELLAGLERHKLSALWRDVDTGELRLAEIAKWYPPDRFITRRTYQDHPPPWAPRKPTDRRLSATDEALELAREMDREGKRLC